MKTRFLLFAVFFVSLTTWAATPFDKMSLKGCTDKANPVDYKINEPIVFTISTSEIDAVPTNDVYSIAWTRTGDDGVKETGSSPFVIGETCVVTTKLSCAGFVRLEAFLVDGKGTRVKRSCAAPGCPDWLDDRYVFFDGGAGVEIDCIRPEKSEPADFDQFWATQRKLLSTVPVTDRRKEVEPCGGCIVYEVTVACLGPRPVTGYLFVPERVSPKSCRACVAFQGYGFYKQLCPVWKAERCVKNNEIVFEINAHGYELGREQSYYDAFGDSIRTKKYSYAFSPEENEDPNTAYFRFMALRVMRALDYVKTLPEWNGKDLIVEGGSQGGLQTSWAAHLDKDVTLARPSITWGCDFGVVTGSRLFGHWYIPWAKGLDYFDAVNHIRRAKCPVEITRAGLGDYTCPPSGLAAYYNAISSSKSIRWVQGSRHGYVPPQPNQEITLGFKQNKGLKVRFLGTGAADWNGRDARGELRRLTSILVENAVLVDFTSTALDMIPSGVQPKTIFYTHSHDDHYQPLDAVKLGVTRVYTHASWVDDARTEFAAAAAKLRVAAPEVKGLSFGETVTEDGVSFTALAANHRTRRANELAAMYLIEKDGTRLLYATDTAGIMGTAAAHAGIDAHISDRRGITALIMEATMGVGRADDFRIFQHSSVDTVAQTVRVLSETKRYHPSHGQKVYLTHMARTLHGTQAEIEAALPVSLYPAYDGLEVVFNEE